MASEIVSFKGGTALPILYELSTWNTIPRVIVNNHWHDKATIEFSKHPTNPQLHHAIITLKQKQEQSRTYNAAPSRYSNSKKEAKQNASILLLHELGVLDKYIDYPPYQIVGDENVLNFPGGKVMPLLYNKSQWKKLPRCILNTLHQNVSFEYSTHPTYPHKHHATATLTRHVDAQKRIIDRDRERERERRVSKA